MSTVWIAGADEILRPPERRPALPAPRPRRRDDARRRRPAARRRRDRHVLGRGLPARRRPRLHGPAGLRRLPHAPAVRRVARGRVRDEGHRRPVRADRAQRRRDRVVGAGVRAPPRTRRSSPRRGRSRARCSRPARRRSRARPATASPTTPSAAPSASAARSASQVEQTMAMTGLFAHAVPDGWTADAWMDEVEAPRGRDRRRRARHLRRDRRVRQRAPRAPGRASPPRAACRCAPRRAVRGEPVGPGRARRRRALGRPPRVPAPGRPRAARGQRDAPPSCSRAPSSSATRRSPPARALADAGAICVLGTDLNPGHLAGRVDPGRSSASPSAATGGRSARRCSRCTLNAAYVLGLSRRGRLARDRQARRRDPARRARRARALPLRPQPGLRRLRRGPPRVGAAGQRVAPGGHAA